MASETLSDAQDFASLTNAILPSNGYLNTWNQSIDRFEPDHTVTSVARHTVVSPTYKNVLSVSEASHDSAAQTDFRAHDPILRVSEIILRREFN